jgi:TatA/E family protein of Tat protein translocase
MFGIGMPEMILILAVALIVIGPKKLPDLAKSLGKAMGEFKKATSDLKESMQIDTELKEVKSAFDDIAKDDPKPAATESGAVNAHPSEEMSSDSPSQTADSMDRLKAAFDRQHAEDDNAPADQAPDTESASDDASVAADTNKGSAS